MKKLVQYGAGNIGRGFIGQLFSESGYEVVFIDINQTIVERLNEDRRYPIRIVSDEGYREIIVRNVRAVSGLDIDTVSNEIATADIMATSVGANILPKITGAIVEGIRKRWTLLPENPRPLDILLCENLHNASIYMGNLLKDHLSSEEKEMFDRTIGLVETSIGRMVPVMTPEMQGDNILRIVVEEYCNLPVDSAAFKGPVPLVNNLLPFSPFSFYADRKLYIHNMGHAIAAYLGYEKKYNYIWEAIKDPEIKRICQTAMCETAAALSSEYKMDLPEIIDHVNDLLQRFGNRQLGDTVLRVGRDTRRKLASGDRLAGAAVLCLKHGIEPLNICKGIVSALKFDADDPGTSEIQGIIKEFGAGYVLTKICGFPIDSKLYKMVMSGLKTGL